MVNGRRLFALAVEPVDKVSGDASRVQHSWVTLPGVTHPGLSATIQEAGAGHAIEKDPRSTMANLPRAAIRRQGGNGGSRHRHALVELIASAKLECYGVRATGLAAIIVLALILAGSLRP